MADLLLPENLHELLERRGGPSVSVYLPTHRVATGDEDRILLRNLLSDVERDLLQTGMRRPDVHSLLAPARELVDNADFWSYQSDGLAVFASPGWSRALRLPVSFPALAVVGEHLHVTPLLELLATDGHFYVLALSQNEVRLLAGTRQRVEQVEIADVPQGLSEYLVHDDLEKQKQLHIAGRGGVGATAAFHGHGIGGEVDKVLLERFLRAVDTGLEQILAGERAPVVLAGVGYVLDRFRLLTRLPHVLDEGIPGNPDQLRADELHQRAWSLVEPVFAAAQQEEADRILAAAPRGRAAASPQDVVPAAMQGRVETLFVPSGAQWWGRIDTDTLEVTVSAERQPGDVDLADRAAAMTLLHSGRVLAVPADEVPGPGPMAALLRY